MRIPASLVVESDHLVLQRCDLYKGHLCAVVNAHHICPKSWFEAAGHLVSTPMINLCPTCHFNTHAAIDATIRGLYADHLPPRTLHLAQQAFDLAAINGLTPAVTL